MLNWPDITSSIQIFGLNELVKFPSLSGNKKNRHFCFEKTGRSVGSREIRLSMVAFSRPKRLQFPWSGWRSAVRPVNLCRDEYIFSAHSGWLVSSLGYLDVFLPSISFLVLL